MDHARIDPEPNGGTEASADGGVATDDRTDERDEPYVKRSVRIQERDAIYRVGNKNITVGVGVVFGFIGSPYSIQQACIQQVDDGGKPVSFFFPFFLSRSPK